MPATSPDDRTTWTAADYRPTVLGAAAAKLADSQVAPLVAAARSYRSARTADDLERIASTFGLDAGRFTRSYADLVAGGDEDMLVLPWFVAKGNQAGSVPTPSTIQLRPQTPPVDEQTGKPKKYLFLAGEKSVLETHPATPISWVGSAQEIVITEGVIKADAALSAMLETVHGTEALRFAGSVGAGYGAWEEDRERALTELARLMEAVPPHQRVLLVGIGGVGNWHNKTEWGAIELKDRTVAVAFDGDVYTNKAVQAQAVQLNTYLTSRKADVRLLDLDSPLVHQRKAERGIPDADKVGLDDFLARLGTWAEIRDLYAPMPTADTDAPKAKVGLGTLRVAEHDNTIVEKYDREPGENATWKQHPNDQGVFVTGRVVENRVRRMSSVSEIAGTVDNVLDIAAGSESTVEITVTPNVRYADSETFEVAVPGHLLDASPAEWAKLKIFIPSRMRQLGAWPPYNDRADSAAWLRMMNTTRVDETRDVHAWETIGWVPDGTGGAAFALSNGQILTRDAEACTAVAAMDASVFPDAEKFGIVDTYGKLDFETWRASFLDDLRAVMSAYIDDGPWSDKAYGVLSLAVMIRPTIPLRPSTSVLAIGPMKSGKSYWASLPFSGWQRQGGTWTNDVLPGSANDTKPSTEDSMARTPLWVLDDLSAALSNSKRDEMESMVGDALRSVHNATARRRMDLGRGGQKSVPRPRCVLIVTAENELRDTSVLNRTIVLPFAKGVFAENGGHRRSSQMRDADEPAPSRLVAGMIRYWLLGDQPWSARIDEARRMQKTARQEMSTWLQEQLPSADPGENEREVNKISDALMGLYAIRAMLTSLGVDESDPMMQKLSWARGGYFAMLAGMSISGIHSSQQNRPGSRLLEALRDILSTKRAYISNAVIDGAPPVVASPESGVSSEQASFANRQLGWEYDASRGWTHRSNAVEIGAAAVLATGGRAVIFNPRTAFREAKSQTADLITAGQTASTTWNDFYAEGLVDESYKRPSNGGHTQVRFGPGGHSRLRGVVVPLHLLVGEDVIEDVAPADDFEQLSEEGL